MTFRSPLITVLGHVDHGKTSLLDKIRKTTVNEREPGRMTQHIGASYIPAEVIKKLSKEFLEQFKITVTIPGLLAIDTPGHEAFINLRKRGGSIADLAVLVIDLRDGIRPQTREAVSILKQFKVPFIIALNKVDLIPGWKSYPDKSITSAYNNQKELARNEIDMKVYDLMSAFHEFGFEVDLFFNIEDFTKKIAMIPCSAKTGEGIPEILALLIGLSQKFLEKRLVIDSNSPAKGSVIEVKEEKGLGKTLDVVIYDGVLRTGDTIVIAGLEHPIVTKIKAMLVPEQLAEIREKSNFRNVKEVYAASGVKISAQNIDEVISGMPIVSVWDETKLEEVKKEIQKEVEEVIVETSSEGILLKADSLGSLEAIIGLMKRKNIQVRKAKIGDITKKDIDDAIAMKATNKNLGVIFAFNIKISEEVEKLAEANKIKIISSNIIYRILEEYEEWQNQSIEREKLEEFEKLSVPAMFRIIPGFVFHQSSPAVCGIEILSGTLKSGIELMKLDGTEIGKLVGLEDNGEKIESAVKGSKVAASIRGAVIGRNLKENDELITIMNSDNFRKLKNFKEKLTEDDIELLKKIAEIKRKKDSLWGY